jgi:hypothetical protein
MLIVLVVVVCGAGCKQRLGDRCQLHRDCDDGLTCVLPVGGTCKIGGVCQAEQDEGKRCRNDGDCAPGLACLTSTVCTEEGHAVCTAMGDMGALADGGASDGAMPAAD